MTLLLAGCGGHSGSGGSGSGGGSSFSPSNQYTLNDNVVELDKTSTVVTSVTADTIVLTGAPALTPGQVLIHNATDDTRFLRKVVSVTVSGGTTTVATTDAAATDVFAKANIAQDSYASAADLLKLQPAQDGVAFTAVDGKGQARDGIQKINLNFNGFQVKDEAGKVIADVSGTVSLAAGVETVWRQANKFSLPYEAGVSGLAQVSGSLVAHARASGSFSREVPVSFTLPIPVTPLGPLGVNLNLQMLMKVDGTYSADGQFSVTANATAKAGVHYDNATHWQFSHSFDKGLTLTPPSLRGSLELGVSLIRPSITADILGMGKAYVKADALKAVAKISGQTTPVPGFLVEGFGDFGFTVGGSLYIGPWKLWSDERNYELGRFSLIKPFLLKTLAPAESQIAYLSPTRTALYAANGDGRSPRLLYTAPVVVFTPDVSNANKKICFVSYDKTSYAPTLTTITPDGKTVAKVNVGSLQPSDPSWSPNGSEIAFDAADGAGVKQINVVNLATGAVRKLTSESKGGGATEPTWSPDGSKIYYQRFSNSVFNVSYTNSATATYDVALANDSRSYTDPNLNPSGTLLVAKRSDVGIVVTDEKGQNERTLVGSTNFSHPRFSPDGSQIVVQDETTSTLYLFDVGTGNRTTIGAGIAPSWGLR